DENMDMSGESATPVDGDRPMSDVEETTTLAVTDYEEKALFEQRKKEAEERHLYLSTKMLEISIVELETKKFFKVCWLGTTIKEEEVIDVRLPKTAIINDILEALLQKLSLSVPTDRIRLYEVLHCKIQKEYDSNDPIDKIQEQSTLYAEEIPQDEIEKSTNDRAVQVYHFTKEPLRSHGIPFKFVIKAGEPFSATKLRLQSRLGMNEKDFSKVKVAIVQPLSYAKPQYIEDDNDILSDHKWADELLGLDHVDKTGRAGRVIESSNCSIKQFLFVCF
ncbi:302_t:CDS:2, partial [Dentiscutata erythropus]